MPPIAPPIRTTARTQLRSVTARREPHMSHRLLCTAALCLASCSAPTAKVMPFIASIGLDGDLSIQDKNAVGGASSNSSFDDLGVGDDESAFGGMARIGFGGAELSLAAIGIGYEGSGTTDSEFEFNGETITANTDVDTNIDLQMARALFTWDLIPIGGVDFGLGIGATVLDLDFELMERGGAGARIATEQTIPVPLIGARAAWTWGPVDLRADVGGLVIEYDGDEATVIDGELSAAVEFLGVGDLVVGYRITSIDAQYEDEDAKIDTDFDLEGYYFGLQFGF